MPRSRRIDSPLGLALFVGAFTLFNAVIAYLLLVGPFFRWNAAKTWTATPCAIEQSRLTHSSGSGKSKGGFNLQIAYAYQVGGKDYSGARYSVMPGFLSGALGIKSVLAKNPPGTKTVCYVNPQDPSDAVLNRNFTPFMLLALVPILFCLMGGLWFVAFTRQRMKK